MNYIPELKVDVELSRFDTSNTDPRYLVSYGERQWVVREKIFKVIKSIDGQKDLDMIYDELQKFNLIKSKDELIAILDNQLTKMGILKGTELTTQSTDRYKYMFLKVNLISSSIIEKFKFLTVLLNKRVSIIALISGIVTLLTTLYLNHEMLSFKSLLEYRSSNFMYMFFIMLSSVLIHEFGHMCAAMKYNIKPGNIGFAIYFIKPILFADVSNVWKLNRKQRLLIDLGGIYFQFIFLSVVALLSIMLNSKLLLFSSVMGCIILLSNINPFIKLDGYWIVSDYLGIYNLHDTMSKYLMECVQILIGAKKSPSIINQIQKKERNLFILYTIASLIFFILYGYGLIKLCGIIIAQLLNRFNGDMSHELTNSIVLCLLLLIIVNILLKTATSIFRFNYNILTNISSTPKKKSLDKI